jgi:glycosyltransferase involved in cell wall biosynthesis
MISIVIPCYNESDVIKLFIEELQANIVKINKDFEIIFIDNNSSDATLEILKNDTLIFKKKKIICLSNYFGKEAAMLAGLDNSKGEAIIIMDPDLEDPPEIIKILIQKYEEGFDVCYAIRNSEKTTLLKKILKKIFYYLIKISSDNYNSKIPANTGDYRIISRQVKDSIINCRETTRFMRGIISYVGYKQTGIYFNRKNRPLGESKSTIGFLTNYGMDALFSYSNIPIRLLTKIGLFGITLTTLLSIFLITQKIFGQSIKGFTFLGLIISLFFAFNIFALGIVGEYVSRIYNEVKKRPNYLIKKIIEN